MLNDADSISTRNHYAALHLGKVVLHLSTNADYPFAHPNTRIANHSMCQPLSPLTMATPPLALQFLATLLLIKLIVPAAFSAILLYTTEYCRYQ